MAAKFAVSLMALLGAVSAQTGYTNSSSIATSTTSSASSTFSNGAMVTAAGVVYSIMDDTTYSDVTPLRLSRKRQASSGIGSCLNTCSDSSACVGASYSDESMQCSYYSSIDRDTETSSPGTDFALVESRPGASSSANSTTSATGTHSATRPGVSGSSNSTGSATGSSSRPAGITGAGNSTSSRPTGSASRTSSSATSAPSAPSTLITIDGVIFLLEIGISKSGITISLEILAKRAGDSLDSCLRTCAADTACAATSFDTSDNQCTFYSSVDAGSAVADSNVDFATVISRAAQTGAGTNGTSGAGNTTSPATPSNSTAESFICPAFNAAILKSNTQITFSISCSSFLIGTTFDLEVSALAKRQTFDNGLPQTLSNCVDLCSLSAECVGTTFEVATGTCSYYSAVQYSTVLAGYDSAVRVQNNGNAGETTTTTVINGVTSTVTVPAGTTTQYVAGPTSTATVYSTITSIVTANGGGATALPSGATVTSIVSLTTTTYVNSVPTITLPQNYAAQTVTITQGAGAAAPTVTESVTITVDGNGNVIGSSTADAAAGAAGLQGSYPTVTMYAACTTPAAQQNSVVWTTVYV
ncbi:hypothetical protein KCU93_g3025, partial [Aureobasidium melanogenum]